MRPLKVFLEVFIIIRRRIICFPLLVVTFPWCSYLYLFFPQKHCTRAAASFQSHRAPQHSTAGRHHSPGSGFWPCFGILSVLWELLLRLFGDSWEPFEEHQGACCCWERGCDHPETLIAGGGQEPAQPQGEEGQGGWVSLRAAASWPSASAALREGPAAFCLSGQERGIHTVAASNQGPAGWEAALNCKPCGSWQGTSCPWARKMPLRQRRPPGFWAASGRASPAAQGRWSFPSILHWWNTPGILCPELGSLAQERHEHTGGSVVKGHEGD